jgi:hypothetical protein
MFCLVANAVITMASTISLSFGQLWVFSFIDPDGSIPDAETAN